jgi:hypothetical protein
MVWSGDISGMGQLAENIGKLGTVPSRAAPMVATGIGDLIEQEFEEGRDPYGRAWAELTDATLAKRSQTTEPPLTDDGDMRRSVDVRPRAGAGIGITIDHPAAPHQTGWNGPQGHGPARPILPGMKMPIAWRETIDAAVDATVRSTVRR